MKTYAKYKPSGVEWLGDVPEHWNVSRLKYVADVQPSNVDKKSNDGEVPVSLCNYVDVYKNEFINSTLKFMEATATPEEIEKFKLREGDVLVTKDSETPDDIAIPALVKEDFDNVICAYHLTHIRPDSNALNGSYLFRLFQEQKFNSQFHVKANGVTRFGLPTAAFTDAFVTLPPIEEQTAIADYLDDKTSRIDRLVAAKKNLIGLLREERTAVIHQAVTRGLNPNVATKWSNIEWLGDIPAHWEVKKLKHIAQIKYGLGQPPKQKDNGLPLIRATNVERGVIVEKDLIHVDPDDVPYDRDPILKANDIIVVRSGAYTADSAIVPKKFEGAIAGYDMVMRVDKAVPKFIAYCLLSDYVLDKQLYLQKLRAAQPHLNKEELGETLILLPTEDEQNEIVVFIERKSEEIFNTIAQIEKEIDLLQEYRTALISEAVTGKIKVV